MTHLTAGGQAAAASPVGEAESTLIIDAGDQDIEAFAERVLARVDFTPARVVAEHGADETYPIVGAASIIAKTRRDARIEQIDAQFDEAVGSGYPGDGETREFLADVYDSEDGWPACVRASWGTAESIADSHSQTTLEEYDSGVDSNHLTASEN